MHWAGIYFLFFCAVVDLQKRIINRMRSFGITPVFPGFAGFIPRAILKHYPSIKAVESHNWCKFPPNYSGVWLLDPQDPLFMKIGALDRIKHFSPSVIK